MNNLSPGVNFFSNFSPIRSRTNLRIKNHKYEQAGDKTGEKPGVQKVSLRGAQHETCSRDIK
jgi:hypothetical protein